MLVYMIISFFALGCEGLKTVQDDDVMNLIRAESYVVVLFSTKDCEACDNFETALTNVEAELSKEFNSPVVKVFNSQLTRLYSPTKEPAVVFFRHGIPLLYSGIASEELIVHTFINNKEPVVKELNDDTFEHLTQAASGATTGDWFVMFYTQECVDCHRLQARLEAVGAQLKNRVNLARVNKGSTGAATAARFQITQAPSFLLFKQGKFYRYHIQKYDVASFVSFALDWYKNLKPERVPLPQTPFDHLVEKVLVSIQENALVVKASLGLFSLALVIAVMVKYRGESQKKQKTADKKANKDK